jgi:predicted DNA-binding transcriptional regulator AlpA
VTDSRAHLAALADALPPEAVVPVPVAWLRELLAPIDTNPPEGQGEEPRGPSEDRLLTVAEAAPRLGVTEDWLYRHAKQLPFTVRLGRKTLRFSMLKLERYLATRRQPA